MRLFSPGSGLRSSLLVTLATIGICAQANFASAQVRTWDDPGSGDWSLHANWSSDDRPDSALESADLGGGGSYTVTYDLGATTISDLNIGNSNAELLFQPASNQVLSVDNNVNNSGTISLNSDGLLDVTLAVNNGLLTNHGTIRFGGTSVSTSTERRLSADVANHGTVNVNQDGHLNRSNGIFNNHGSVNILASKILDFESATGTFNQESGTVDNQGEFKFNGDTLNFNGGSFLGNAVDLESSTLSIGATSTGVGTFNMSRAGNYSGDLAAAQTLNVLAGTSNTVTTATADFTNHGTINLDSSSLLDTTLVRDGTITNEGTIGFGGTSGATTTERRLNADVVNNGTVNISQDGHLNRNNGVFTNHGNVNIDSGKVLDFETATGTFNQNSGTVDNQGAFNFVSDTLNFNGGQFTGNAVNLESSTLNIGATSTGAGEFDMTRAGSYSGNLASAQTLNIRDGSANTVTTATSDFTNQGTINLDSDSQLDVALNRDGVITNQGAINFGGTSASTSTERRLSADVINQGAVNVNQDAHLNRALGTFTNHNQVNIASGKTLDFEQATGTFNQEAGTVDNQGAFNFNGDTLNFNGGTFTGNAVSLEASTLNIGAASTGAGVFNMTRSGSYSGDLAAAQTLNLFDGSGNNVTTATADFTNYGTINLNSDSALDVTLTRDGSVTNDGLIRFGGTSDSASTVRRLAAEVFNEGTVEFDNGSTANMLGMAGADHRNSGLIVSYDDSFLVTVSGDSFTNTAEGTLAGVGEYDFSETGLISDGVIAPGLSPGTMTLEGDVTLGATSQLQFELGGTLQGTEHDFLDVLGTMELAGGLDVSFVDGFENTVSSSDVFTIASATSLNGTFMGLAEGSTVSTSDGLGNFSISYQGNQVVLGNYSSVPEPSMAFLVSGLALVVVCRRRRRKA